MTITFDCTEWMKEHCPAVVHIDGTARPQFVDEESNPDLCAILKEYSARTGIPALINTSYNIHNEPIVRTAAEAIRVFKETCLDYLAIGDYLVSAKENGLVWQGSIKSTDDTGEMGEDVLSIAEHGEESTHELVAAGKGE